MGWTQKPAMLRRGGRAPSTLTAPGSRPVSSSVSRNAHSRGSSSPSRAPPGNETWPGWCGRSERRRVKSSQSRPSRENRGARTAAARYPGLGCQVVGTGSRARLRISSERGTRLQLNMGKCGSSRCPWSWLWWRAASPPRCSTRWGVTPAWWSFPAHWAVRSPATSHSNARSATCSFSFGIHKGPAEWRQNIRQLLFRLPFHGVHALQPFSG